MLQHHQFITDHSHISCGAVLSWICALVKSVFTHSFTNCLSELELLMRWKRFYYSFGCMLLSLLLLVRVLSWRIEARAHTHNSRVWVRGFYNREFSCLWQLHAIIVIISWRKKSLSWGVSLHSLLHAMKALLSFSFLFRCCKWSSSWTFTIFFMFDEWRLLLMRPPCVHVVPGNAHLSGSHKIFILLDSLNSLANWENELVVIPLFIFFLLLLQYSVYASP